MIAAHPTLCQEIEEKPTRMPNIKVLLSFPSADCFHFVANFHLDCHLAVTDWILILIAKVFSGSSHPDLAHKICDRFEKVMIKHHLEK